MDFELLFHRLMNTIYFIYFILHICYIISICYITLLYYIKAYYYMYINFTLMLSFSAFTGWETKNKYVITDNRGELVFYMAEESGICWRLCVGKYRSCEFSIYDKNRHEILRMIRPFRCDGCCCPCYLQVVLSLEFL